MAIGGLLLLLLLVTLIAVIVLLWSKPSRPYAITDRNGRMPDDLDRDREVRRESGMTRGSAEQYLNERFARGEIDEVQYLRQRDLIRGS